MPFTKIQGDVYLTDDDGNAVGIVLDGTEYRIQGENLLVGKTEGAGSNKEVSVIDDADESAAKRLLVEADIKPGATINVVPSAVTATQAVILDLEESGGSDEMVIDGDPTPVVFEVTADPDDDILLSELRMMFIADPINWGHFGKAGGALTVGVEISINVNEAVSPTVVSTIYLNDDFVALLRTWTEFGGNYNLLVSSIVFSGVERLVAGSSDYVRITINDDLTSVLRKIQSFRAKLHGSKET